MPASLRKVETEIRAHLNKAVAQGRIEKADAVFPRIEYASTVEEAAPTARSGDRGRAR